MNLDPGSFPCCYWQHCSCVVVCSQLLQRDPGERLGCIEDKEKIRAHAFFREIDFVKLEARKLKSPFKPNVVSSFYQWLYEKTCL